MTMKQIDNRIAKIRRLEEERKELEKQISEIRSEIQNEMQDAERLETNRYIIKWTSYITDRFDTNRFKEEQENLYNAYTTSRETRRFSYAIR